MVLMRNFETCGHRPHGSYRHFLHTLNIEHVYQSVENMFCEARYEQNWEVERKTMCMDCAASEAQFT